MLVELATTRDAARVAELAQSGGATLDVATELGRTWAKLWLAREHVHGEALGFLLAWDAADEVHLVDVVTHPSARRRGVATALLQVLLAHASARSARMVLLEVRRSNEAALALYRRAGFHAVGVRRAYYAEDGEDALEMQLDFDPDTGLAVLADDQRGARR